MAIQFGAMGSAVAVAIAVVVVAVSLYIWQMLHRADSEASGALEEPRGEAMFYFRGSIQQAQFPSLSG